MVGKGDYTPTGSEARVLGHRTPHLSCQNCFLFRSAYELSYRPSMFFSNITTTCMHRRVDSGASNYRRVALTSPGGATAQRYRWFANQSISEYTNHPHHACVRHQARFKDVFTLQQRRHSSKDFPKYNVTIATSRSRTTQRHFFVTPRRPSQRRARYCGNRKTLGIADDVVLQ